MTLSIESERAEQLAHDLVALTGESIADAVVAALEARLEFERRRRGMPGIGDIVEQFADLAVLDERSAEDITGYDERGLPT